MTAQEQGRRFEEKVARWAQNRLWGDYRVVKVTRKGDARGSPPDAYDVDVHMTLRGMVARREVWIESKFRSTRPVERDDVLALVGKATDACRIHRSHKAAMHYDALIIVSNSGFSKAALEYANTWDVLCVTLGSTREFVKNNPDWLDSPVWLRQAMAKY